MNQETLRYNISREYGNVNLGPFEVIRHPAHSQPNEWSWYYSQTPIVRNSFHSSLSSGINWLEFE